MLDDFGLLREFADSGSESAFEELVSRHINFVYSAALRQVQDPDLAQEITQAVFVLLARKASGIRQPVVLAGWLFQTTRFVALAQIRSAARRRRYEEEAQMQTGTEAELPEELWADVWPHLDQALAGLGETDRRAVLLRYFESKSLAEVGRALGLKEDAARKRVDRALLKLNQHLRTRGITSTAAVLAGLISANGVQAAPGGLIQVVTAGAVTQGAASSSSVLGLIKGALKMMAWTKTKVAIGVGSGILLAAGTATVTVEKIRAQEAYPWQVPEANFDTLHDTPAQVVIVPTKFAEDGHWCGEDDRVMGIAQTLKQVAICAYRGNALRTVVEGDLPDGRYDFIANLPRGKGSGKALQAELRKKFGVVGRSENRETDVLLLRLIRSSAPGLKPGSRQPPDTRPGMTIAISVGQGQFHAYNQPIGILAANLESDFKIPIVNRTGLSNSYDMTLNWSGPNPNSANHDALKQALADQLGMELVASREPLQMLVVTTER